MTPAELVDEIVATHHDLLKRELPRLSNALSVEGNEELAGAFRQLEAYLMLHLGKEEQILFPAIKDLCRGRGASGCLQGAMMQMNYEHEIIGQYELQLRVLAQGSRHEAEILALLDDLAVHASKEDDLLFPKVRLMLDDAAA